MKKTTKKAATKITISAEQALANFTTMAALLINSAKTEKAVEFAIKTTDAALSKGADWLAAHCAELNIINDPAKDFCPVADNRAFHMANIQVALMA